MTSDVDRTDSKGRAIGFAWSSDGREAPATLRALRDPKAPEGQDSCPLRTTAARLAYFFRMLSSSLRKGAAASVTVFSGPVSLK